MKEEEEAGRCVPHGGLWERGGFDYDYDDDNEHEHEHEAGSGRGVRRGKRAGKWAGVAFFFRGCIDLRGRGWDARRLGTTTGE